MIPLIASNVVPLKAPTALCSTFAWSSNSFNVVLSATLFHPISEPMEAEKIGKKHLRIVNENLFKKVLIMAIQKETFDAVYDFLESEANDEK